MTCRCHPSNPCGRCVPTPLYLPTTSLAESVARAFGRGQELELRDVVSKVRNDYGSVSDRAVSRYLAVMVRRGDIEREGVRGHYTYRRTA